MKEPDPKFVAHVESGERVDMSVLDEVAHNPETMTVDLTKDEKRRTTALMLAIQGYRELIIKDAAYLREVSDMARRNEGPKIRSATIDAMVEAAWKFDLFIAGRLSAQTQDEEPVGDGGAQTEAPANPEATP